MFSFVNDISFAEKEVQKFEILGQSLNQQGK